MPTEEMAQKGNRDPKLHRNDAHRRCGVLCKAATGSLSNPAADSGQPLVARGCARPRAPSLVTITE